MSDSGIDEDAIRAMGIGALKKFIVEHGGSCDGCIEKSDLVARAVSVASEQPNRADAARACGCECNSAPDEAATRGAGGTFDFEHTMAVGPLKCNCTILGNTATGEVVVCDPGGDLAEILAVLDANKLSKVTSILITHAHFDHFLAAGTLRDARGGAVKLHPDDRQLWDMLPLQMSFFGIRPGADAPSAAPTIDADLEDDEEIEFGGRVLHVPGHSPGSCGFYFARNKLLLSGDCLFRRSVGRTDLWGGSAPQLKNSIREKFYTLPEDTRVVCGHGPPTTIGDEMRMNTSVRMR